MHDIAHLRQGRVVSAQTRAREANEDGKSAVVWVKILGGRSDQQRRTPGGNFLSKGNKQFFLAGEQEAGEALVRVAEEAGPVSRHPQARAPPRPHLLPVGAALRWPGSHRRGVAQGPSPASNLSEAVPPSWRLTPQGKGGEAPLHRLCPHQREPPSVRGRTEFVMSRRKKAGPFVRGSIQPLQGAAVLSNDRVACWDLDVEGDRIGALKSKQPTSHPQAADRQIVFVQKGARPRWIGGIPPHFRDTRVGRNQTLRNIVSNEPALNPLPGDCF